MDAGALDQKIIIETRSVVHNALGEEVESWSPSPAWAKVTETPGREFLKGDYQAERKAVFCIRFKQVDTTARVTWGGQVYDIQSVTGTYREGWAYLHCVARVN